MNVVYVNVFVFVCLSISMCLYFGDSLLLRGLGALGNDAWPRPLDAAGQELLQLKEIQTNVFLLQQELLLLQQELL